MPQYEFGRKIKRPVAYVFAGGASYGSIQAGMLRALHQRVFGEAA